MRIRTTKKLGQRVDRTYVKRLFPIPLWRRILTAGSLAIALGWLGFYAVARNQTPYTAGALTPAHAFLGKQCANCHGGSAGIGKKVADKQCVSCHDAPLHNAAQVTSPACVECHVEHRGTQMLADPSNQSCVACHGGLQIKGGGTPTVAVSITSFSSHPQFAPVAAGSDKTGIKFNHAKHVGELSQKCADCHPAADTSQGMAKPDPHSHVSSRALMAIPTYAGTCMPCHALNFDDKISDAAPHDKPEAVDKFVKETAAKYFAAHPGDLGGVSLAARIASDEKQMWDTVCGRCHAMGAPDASGLPTVPPAKVTARWFTKASFDHAAHQGLTCASCHAKAATSTVSSDMLLPGIATCQSCHNSSRTSAGSNCSTCHVYHDWSKEKSIDGKYTIDKMTLLTGHRPQA
ncbi:MAG: hypothetical protein KGN84_10075 [Acidobacteriota bacterium]|nr:hypothetical protein [Acidobacteriota bacterium]